MISLGEKVAALNFEVGVQQLANQIAILTAIGDFAKILGADVSPEYYAMTYGPIVDRMAKELNTNAEFMRYANDKLTKIIEKGPPSG